MKYIPMLGLAFTLVGGAASPTPAHAQGHRRAMLEQRYRALGERIVRKRLNLSNEQVQKLRDVNSRYATQRRALLKQQKDVQLSLRNEIARGPGADQRHVAALNAQLNGLIKQRFELQQQERGDLSKFLTPIQQAQYEGLQAQIRQKMQNIQGRPPGPAEESPPAP